jgi:glucose/arabinose dehydrogenase
VFVANAGDGSRRLFVVEQDGTIRVWHAGAATSSSFRDVRDRVLSGGERGLLGLASHPLYRVNGRFFIYYTRKPDGAIVIAEYQVTSDPDVASRTERLLLTIPHPVNANHNGGMLAFGPGGYLFIGVGDGGSANDPPNNAQNMETLLGKILRLDVDRADIVLGIQYSAPASNPFVGKAGRDEIYAFGFRNPWRFSFDRRTNQQWVGDVGQDDSKKSMRPSFRRELRMARLRRTDLFEQRPLPLALDATSIRSSSTRTAVDAVRSRAGMCIAVRLAA